MAADPSFQIIASSLDLERTKICTHCHTGITSLWRNGPSGSKSLCNACGLRYQRKGMEALDSESKGCKGKITKKGMEGTRRQRKVIKLKSNGKNGKKTETKQPDEVDLRGMLTTTGCWKEMMMPQIQQHGEEEVKAAIQLMNLSGATFC